MSCWRCEKKAEMLQDRINQARLEAGLKSVEYRETMAIVKVSGCVYKVVKASETIGLNVVEYVSESR